LDYYSTACNVAAGTLDAARGTMPLVTLGALTLIGTAGILIRRNRRDNSEI
jgi:LPXTG-motif cell wall-anchored protein